MSLPVRKTAEADLKSRLPQSFFDVLGTWEDDRDPEEILREIRAELPERVERVPNVENWAE
jgi:hypothetical protein